MLFFIVYQTARMGAPKGLGRPNCSGFLLPADPPLPGQTRSELFEPLSVAPDALLFFPFIFFLLFSMSFFIFFRDLLRSMLGSQADPPTCNIHGLNTGNLTCSAKRRSQSEAGLGSVWGLSRGFFRSSWACLGGFPGALARPERVSRFILELYWALFAR